MKIYNMQLYAIVFVTFTEMVTHISGSAKILFSIVVLVLIITRQRLNDNIPRLTYVKRRRFLECNCHLADSLFTL